MLQYDNNITNVKIGDELQIRVYRSEWEGYWTIRDEQLAAEATRIVESDPKNFRIIRVTTILPQRTE